MPYPNWQNNSSKNNSYYVYLKTFKNRTVFCKLLTIII